MHRARAHTLDFIYHNVGLHEMLNSNGFGSEWKEWIGKIILKPDRTKRLNISYTKMRRRRYRYIITEFVEGKIRL